MSYDSVAQAIRELGTEQTADIEGARAEMRKRWRILTETDFPDPALVEYRRRKYEQARDRLLRMVGAL